MHRNTIQDVYKVSISDHRRTSKKRVRENESCYESLKNKDSEYARIVKQLGDLHRAVAEIYTNAPDIVK